MSNRKVFECLAKGCAIFENGNEFSSGPIDEEFYDERAVHFDLKKENGLPPIFPCFVDGLLISLISFCKEW